MTTTSSAVRFSRWDQGKSVAPSPAPCDHLPGWERVMGVGGVGHGFGQDMTTHSN